MFERRSWRGRGAFPMQPILERLIPESLESVDAWASLSTHLSIASTSRVAYSVPVSSLVAINKPGATSNTCIFQPGGAGIGSRRILRA